ncbi:MAG: response regulator transcription factor [Gaiellaceae bacterium]
MRAARQPDISVLVADDDEAVRFLLTTVLRATDGIGSVVEAVDGPGAVEAGRRRRFDVAVLDLQMPRCDGVEAALRLHELQPWLRIALDSGDRTRLHERGAGLGLPLFDKLQLEALFDWVEEQAHELAAGTAATPSALLRSR